MPKVLTKRAEAVPGTPVRVWHDPPTMRHLKGVGELVHLESKRPFTVEYGMQWWAVLDPLTGSVSGECIMVRLDDNAVATPDMLEAWP